MSKQKQKQTQIVNINLGSKQKKKAKGKGKAKKSKRESKTTPAFIPPSIINYPPMFVAPNQPNWFTPPPVSQSNKQYAVFPEGETAEAVGLSPSVPVPLRVETATSVLKPVEKEPNLAEIAGQQPALLPEEEKAPEEVILPVQPPEEDVSFLGESGVEEEEYSLSPTEKREVFQNVFKKQEKARQDAIARQEASFGQLLEAFAPPVAEEKGEYTQVTGKKKSKSSKESGQKAGLFPVLAPPKEEPTSLPLPPIFLGGKRAPFSVGLPPSDPFISSKKDQGASFNIAPPPEPLFLGKPKPVAEKQKELGLERQRGVGVTPAEESILFA